MRMVLNVLPAGTTEHLWTACAQDWIAVEEQQFIPCYREAFDAIPIRHGMSVLDVGCGAGLASRLAADLGARITGIDITARLLETARKRLPDADLRLGRMEALPFPDNGFDAALFLNALQQARTPRTALAEARRVVQPGGTICVVAWSTPPDMNGAITVDVLRRFLPGLPVTAPGPMALADEDTIWQIIRDVRLTASDVFDVDCPSVYPDIDSAVRGICANSTGALAIENAGHDTVTRAVRAAISDLVQPDGTVVAESRYTCFLAKV